jgi:hypothetical protein
MAQHYCTTVLLVHKSHPLLTGMVIGSLRRED